jgi:hypothetical protein
MENIYGLNAYSEGNSIFGLEFISDQKN